MSDTVLVTGATGFIAQHCIVALAQAGYQVRGTARAEGRTGEVVQIIAPHLSPDVRTSFVENFLVVPADLSLDAGWDRAVAGCRFVLHVAGPVPRTPPRHEDEVIVPAREGMLRVLRASIAAGVERVVLTSSTSAIIYGQDRDRTFTESDWSDVDDPRIGAYEKSKTLVERAAWDFMRSNEGNGTELVAVNPGLVLGPLLSGDWGTSGEVVKKIIDRDLPAIPDLNFAAADVRDVAAAHLAAMTEPSAAGKRFICAIENHSMRDIAAVLAAHLDGKGFRIPTGKLPNWVLKVVARWDRTARLGLNDLGVPQHVDSSKARDVLGWSPRGLHEMVTAMADSMILHQIVNPSR